MSLRVCAASASRNSLLSWRARRRSYHTTPTFTNIVAAISATSVSEGKSRVLADDEMPHPFAQQLEARDGEKADDGERAERLELLVAVGMILVGLPRRHPDERDADDVVEHIEGRFERCAEHRERVRAHADDDLDGRHERIQHQDEDQRVADRRLAMGSGTASEDAPAGTMPAMPQRCRAYGAVAR